MKQLFFTFILMLSISACDTEPNIPIQEAEHFVLDDILNYLPFQKFNDFSKAIFRNSAGKEIEFSLSINEDIVEHLFADTIYTCNEITFQYETEFNFEVPNFAIIATIEGFTDLGLTEVIYGGSSIVIASVVIPHLTIIPDRDYKNTVLNKEFTWFDQIFTNVYSNILIEENSLDPVKIFYQSTNGVIGFIDVTNSSWILDRFE